MRETHGSSTFWSIPIFLATGLVFWRLGKPLNLGAPQYVAGFGVRLDFHVIPPPLGFFADSVRLLAFSSRRFGKTRKLAAPHCIAGLGVRLDFHGIAPRLDFVLLTRFGCWPSVLDGSGKPVN